MGNANSIPGKSNDPDSKKKDDDKPKLSSNTIAAIVCAVVLAFIIIMMILIKNIPGFGKNLADMFRGIYTFMYTQPKTVLAFLTVFTFLTAFFIIYNKQIYKSATDTASSKTPIFSTWATDNWIFSIVVVGIIILAMTYLTLSTRPAYINSVPLNMWTILMQRRMMYITYFTAFLICAFLFYFYEPWGLSKDYFGQSTFAIIFIGVFLLGIVMNYTAYFSAKDMMLQGKPSGSWDLFIKAIFILISLGISAGLIYWMIGSAGQLYSTSSIVSFVINILLITVILGLTFRVLMSSHYIQNSPYVRLIVNVVLYIPCILVYLVDLLVGLFYGQKAVGNKTEFVLLGLSVLLMVLYFVVPMIENLFVLQGGKQLINDPIYISSQSGVANYMQLNDLDPKHMPDPMIYNYNYGISFWFYLDSNITGKEKYMTIFNYGDKPRVLYKSKDNTLMITTMPNQAPNKPNAVPLPGLRLDDMDSNGNVIVYTRKNIQLQKWNNLILNYSGGTLDIFYNGEIVKSLQHIVPYMTMDAISVGEPNGAGGGICNLVYFKESLTSSQIRHLYTSVKDKTPPTLYSSTKSLTFKQE
jgi:hypothetical protein